MLSSNFPNTPKILSLPHHSTRTCIALPNFPDLACQRIYQVGGHNRTSAQWPQSSTLEFLIIFQKGNSFVQIFGLLDTSDIVGNVPPQVISARARLGVGLFHQSSR